MADMLVKLYDKEFISKQEALAEKGIIIKRAHVSDKNIILPFVKEHFKHDAWVNEVEYALFRYPTSCWIAVKNKELIGFACYDTTAKGFFGPTGVRIDHHRQGIGAELLIRSMISLKEMGYAYAIIGWVASDAISLYTKVVGAVLIEDSEPRKSIYHNFISSE